MKTKGKGSLPDECPSCKKNVDWEYGEIEMEGNIHWQEINCPECDALFTETYELSGWELMEND